MGILLSRDHQTRQGESVSQTEPVGHPEQASPRATDRRRKNTSKPLNSLSNMTRPRCLTDSISQRMGQTDQDPQASKDESEKRCDEF